MDYGEDDAAIQEITSQEEQQLRRVYDLLCDYHARSHLKREYSQREEKLAGVRTKVRGCLLLPLSLSPPPHPPPPSRARARTYALPCMPSCVISLHPSHIRRIQAPRPGVTEDMGKAAEITRLTEEMSLLDVRSTRGPVRLPISKWPPCTHSTKP